MNDIAVRESNGTAQAKQYTRRAISPPVDVFENADEVLVIADVPGIPGGSIDVRVENGTLTLEARRPSEGADPAIARDPEQADFLRTFRIPAGVDAANISAESKNGTVLVRLPKVAALKARKIAVRSA